MSAAPPALEGVDLPGLVRMDVLDPEAVIGACHVEPVAYAYGSPNTGGLFRVTATARCGAVERALSVFVKIVQSFRHWPIIDVLPPEMREMALAGSYWRYEADVYLGAARHALPSGLRMPRLYDVVDLGDERLALVLEDVVCSDEPWSDPRFARAATLLARAAVRLGDRDVLPPTASRVPAEATARYYTGRVIPAVLPALDDDRTWSHPLLAQHRDLRDDALEVARRIPEILDTLAKLPQVMGHGDASPQNLLVPAHQPDTFVAVDWTLTGRTAVGDDLGQLVVGLAHAGELAVSDVVRLSDSVVDAYVEGLAAEGMHTDTATVRYGLDGGLAVRSALTSLPLERLGGPVTDDLTELVAQRVELTRYLLDLALALA